MTDIVATLRERPYRLASESSTEMQVRRQAEREYAAHEIEVLRLEKAKLAADNERLREVLREVMDDLTLISKNHWLPVGLLDDVIYVNARAALDGQPAPGKEEA